MADVEILWSLHESLDSDEEVPTTIDLVRESVAYENDGSEVAADTPVYVTVTELSITVAYQLIRSISLSYLPTNIKVKYREADTIKGRTKFR